MCPVALTVGLQRQGVCNQGSSSALTCASNKLHSVTCVGPQASKRQWHSRVTPWSKTPRSSLPPCQRYMVSAGVVAAGPVPGSKVWGTRLWGWGTRKARGGGKVWQCAGRSMDTSSHIPTIPRHSTCCGTCNPCHRVGDHRTLHWLNRNFFLPPVSLLSGFLGDTQKLENNALCAKGDALCA